MKTLHSNNLLVALLAAGVFASCSAAQAGGGSHGGAYIAGSHIETVYEAFNEPVEKPAPRAKHTVTAKLVKHLDPVSGDFIKQQCGLQ